MAEPLVAQYGPDIPVHIANTFTQVYRNFDSQAFISDCLKGYETLNLMQRGSHIANALHKHLPTDYAKAIRIVLDSLQAKRERNTGSLASFFYLPHTCFVARYGLDHFDLSMQAQYELTQRFTAEFSIRPYLKHHQEKTLALLKAWTQDDSEHVRRLVSEGTRPRLPWAPRLPQFQKDPQAVLELLELLKDDVSPYVRRSVANNLNDIGKDHPALLVDVARNWLRDASPQRDQLIRHALRSAIKRADAAAFHAIGYGEKPKVEVRLVQLTPDPAVIGGSVALTLSIGSTDGKVQKLLVDLEIGYVKANGECRPKVFKFRMLELAPGETISLSRKISLAQMTTRTHYAGRHTLGLVINGQAYPLGAFNVVAE